MGAIAKADTLEYVVGGANLSGLEVINSGTFVGPLGNTSQGWYTTGSNQNPSTVNGTGVNGDGSGLSVLDLSGNGTSTYNLGDNFAQGDGANPAVGTIKGQSYSFIDTWLLLLPQSTASNFDVSFDACMAPTVCNGVSNLTSRLYSYSGANLNGVGGLAVPGGSATVAQAWTDTVVSGSANYTQFQNIPLGYGEYVFQVAGQVGDIGSSSYSGSLQIQAVPLPAALPLLVSGLGLLGAAARRRGKAATVSLKPIGQ